MILGGLASDDIAAVGCGLALLGQQLAADRAAMYQVDRSGADQTPRLELVASEPKLLDRVPAPLLVPGVINEIRYLPDIAGGGPSAMRTYFGVPVSSRGRTIGLVEMVAARVDAFSPPARQEALTLIPILGRVLDNARRQQAKNAFLALAAHELRTPLTTAAGFAQTIAEQLDRLDPVVIRDLLARILHSHRRLDRLVSDLVDLSSMDGGQLQVSLGPVAVGPLLEEAVCEADNGTHPLSCQVPADLPVIWADRDRLEQVVTNLLANAAKFSPAGSPIAIRAGCRDDAIMIEVADCGRGIPTDCHERIFDAYYQGEALSGGRPRGLGIGLYLTRVLCQLMGGTVTVTSHPGRGSTFVVTLPAVRSAPVTAES